MASASFNSSMAGNATAHMASSSITDAYVLYDDNQFPKAKFDTSNLSKVALESIKAFSSIGGSVRLVPWINSSNFKTVPAEDYSTNYYAIVFNFERINSNDDVISGMEIVKDFTIHLNASGGTTVANAWHLHAIMDKWVSVKMIDGQKNMTVSEVTSLFIIISYRNSNKLSTHNPMHSVLRHTHTHTHTLKSTPIPTTNLYSAQPG
jgi:hypothetical protein